MRSSEDDLMSRFKVKDTPTLILYKANEKKPIFYKGEIKFKPIFEFLNIYSEAFVAGGGSGQDSAALKVWLTETVPQFNSQSANDICYQVKNPKTKLIMKVRGSVVRYSI